MTYSVDDLPQRISSKIQVDEATGCWLFTGAKFATGYGGIRFAERVQLAHRVVYTLLVGEIPTGAEIDHICHVRPCVRPEHLRPVTSSQNKQNRRGATRTSRTGVRGVCMHRGLFMVRVQVGGKVHFGGSFEQLGRAEAAAIALRNELHTHNDLDRREVQL